MKYFVSGLLALLLCGAAFGQNWNWQHSQVDYQNPLGFPPSY